MKRIILLLLATTVLLNSCINPLDPSNNGRERSIIRFSNPITAPSAGVTKAHTELEEATSFCVFAMYYPSEFTTWSAGMPYFGENGDLVSFHSGIHSEDAITYDGWHSANIHYWPSPGSVTFQAYAPAQESIPLGNTLAPSVLGDPIIGSTGVVADISLNTSRGQQMDFLVSERVLNQTANICYPATNIGEHDLYGVQIPFHHSLSRFCFGARLKNPLPEDEYITITHIVILNAYTSGTLQQNLSDDTGAGVLSASTLSWTPTGTLQNYDNAVCETPDTLTTTVNTQDYTSIYLIPQELNAGFKIQITFERVNDHSTSTQTVYISAEELENSLGSNIIAQGKSYNFTFLLGEDPKIYFDPLVKPWTDNYLSGQINYYF